MPATGDKLRYLKRRAKAFIKQEPLLVNKILLEELPNKGGVYLITLIYDKQEMPLYINNCNSIQEELKIIQPVRQLLLNTANLMWLQTLNSELLDKEDTISLLDEQIYVRYIVEPDVKEQMAIMVMAATLLKPLHVGN